MLEQCPTNSNCSHTTNHESSPRRESNAAGNVAHHSADKVEEKTVRNAILQTEKTVNSSATHVNCSAEPVSNAILQTEKPVNSSTTHVNCSATEHE